MVRGTSSVSRTSLDQREHRFLVALGDQPEQVAVDVIRNQTEHFTHPRGRDRSLTERHDLIEDREAVAHPAVRALRDQVERVVIGGHTLGDDDLAEPVGDRVRPNPPEVGTRNAEQNGRGRPPGR